MHTTLYSEKPKKGELHARVIHISYINKSVYCQHVGSK